MHFFAKLLLLLEITFESVFSTIAIFTQLVNEEIAIALCSRNFQYVKLKGLTLLKFDHFTTSPILREIKF